MRLVYGLTIGAILTAVIAAVALNVWGSTEPGLAHTTAGSDARATNTSTLDQDANAGDDQFALTIEGARETRPPLIGSADGVTSAPPFLASNGAPRSASVPATQPAATGLRLRIPDLAVDAAVTPLGFDGAGGYAVPGTAAGVGWYEFSAVPGAAGNAVLGGHLNWRGSRGVFDRLDELSIGDLVYVDTAAGPVTYQVVSSYSVGAQTPFVDILGERTGPSTLTLFTCGGTYSAAAGEYDERLVVTAVRI